jgi:hypothetical protein
LDVLHGSAEIDSSGDKCRLPEVLNRRALGGIALELLSETHEVDLTDVVSDTVKILKRRAGYYEQQRAKLNPLNTVVR